MMAFDWEDISQLKNTIDRRLRDEKNDIGEDGTYDALVEALGFDNGIEMCILWWCKRRSWGPSFWCLEHGEEWSPVYKEYIEANSEDA